MKLRLAHRKRHAAGMTLLEILVVVVILIVLASLIIPALAKARFESRKAQCASNLKQLGSALIMYQSFEGRQQNAFPERLTYMADPAHLYVNDYRLFVCPMDPTHATGMTLKPGNPVDNKYDWAERVNRVGTDVPLFAGDTRKELNCSYLYEFSTRVCQTYNKGNDTWLEDQGDWAENFLVEWYPDDSYDPPLPTPYNDSIGSAYLSGTSPSPTHMSIFGLTDGAGEGIITWQEAKVWQLQNGDICGTGLAYPGDTDAYPAGWFNIYDQDGWQMDPADMIALGYTDATGGTTYSSPQHGYSASWLPIVRCFWHQTPQFVDNENMEEVLNLAVDGNTFYSAPGWEETAWNYGRDGDMPDDGP